MEGPTNGGGPTVYTGAVAYKRVGLNHPTVHHQLYFCDSLLPVDSLVTWRPAIGPPHSVMKQPGHFVD